MLQRVSIFVIQTFLACNKRAFHRIKECRAQEEHQLCTGYQVGNNVTDIHLLKKRKSFAVNQQIFLRETLLVLDNQECF